MKVIYCLCLAVLFGAFASSANAVRLQILDPPGTIDGKPDWEIDPPLSTIDLVPFSSANCLAYPVLPSNTACSLVFNDSGSTIKNLELVFYAPLLGSAPDCGSLAYTDANQGTPDADFDGASCSENDGTYTLEFYGGNGITSGSVFEFVTDGDPSDFPADLTAVPNVPEPASIVMLSSAVAMLGLLLFARRRSLHGSLS